MNTVSKLSIAGAFGALVALTPSGDGALAGPVGVGASAVTPLAMPIENVRWVRVCERRWVGSRRFTTGFHWHPGRWHPHQAMMRGPVVASDFGPDYGFGPTIGAGIGLGPTVATDFGTTCEWRWNGFNWRRVCPGAGIGMFGGTGLLGGGGFLGIF